MANTNQRHSVILSKLQSIPQGFFLLTKHVIMQLLYCEIEIVHKARNQMVKCHQKQSLTNARKNGLMCFVRHLFIGI